MHCDSCHFARYHIYHIIFIYNMFLFIFLFEKTLTFVLLITKYLNCIALLNNANKCCIN